MKKPSILETLLPATNDRHGRFVSATIYPLSTLVEICREQPSVNKGIRADVARYSDNPTEGHVWYGVVYAYERPRLGRIDERVVVLSRCGLYGLRCAVDVFNAEHRRAV